MRVTTPSFKEVEGEKIFTSPNLLSVARAAGGLTLGALMAASAVEPATAAYAAAGLAATDAEGSLIVATRSFPNVQKAIRSFPSRWGRILDPIADKLYAMGIFVGGMVNGAIPVEQGAAVAATEIGTSVATFVATIRRGGETPEVGQVGKIGMIARMGMIAGNLGAWAVDNGAHEALSVGGKVSAAASVALGALSAINIYRQGNRPAETAQAS